MTLIGRKSEILLLHKLIKSPKAEFIALYGRRRIGKTSLIQHCFSSSEIYFECTGVKNGKLSLQLGHFIKRFSLAFHPLFPITPPKSWEDAFELLTYQIKQISPKEKIVLFFDELPWLSGKKSEFLSALDYAWNTSWRLLPNVKLIVCGSAASWMLGHLINAKGGLHNRITHSLLLKPFTLSETNEFLLSKGIKLPPHDLLDLYITVGGVPFYLQQLDPSQSLRQNIQHLFFTEEGLLYGEFQRLFQSLFDASELNMRIVKEVAKHFYGISRLDLLRCLGKKTGGRISERLKELESCGFLVKFLPFGKTKRDYHYRVVDEYTLFYLRWTLPLVEKGLLPKGANYWNQISHSAAWMSFAGYAFENICYQHIDCLLHALQLDKIPSFCSHWLCRSEDVNAQIDLILDRGDEAITLCEIKYTRKPFEIDKSYAKKLLQKTEALEQQTKQKKQIFLVMISVSGVKENAWSQELLHQTISLTDLLSDKGSHPHTRTP